MDGSRAYEQETFRTRMPARYQMIFLLIGAFATIGSATAMATASMTGAILLASLMTAVFLAVVLMQAKVRLEPSEVSIRTAGIFATTIPYHSIDDVTPWKSTGAGAGMGLRVLPHGTTGYLVGGPSVRMTTGSTAVLVSSNTPEKLSEAIEHRRTHQVP